MPFKRGDVVLIYYPNSDLRTFKRRPVLVVSADALQTGLNQTIVAMITSNMARSAGASRVTVLEASPRGQAMGLLTDSVIMADNLATILDSEIDLGIGRCDDMTDVDAALRAALGV